MRRGFLAVVLSILISLPAGGQPTADEINAYPHGEAVRVYRAVLEVLFNGAEKPGVIVIADSLVPYLGPHEDIRASRTGAEPSTVESLVRMTSMPHGRDVGPQFATGAFPRDLGYSIPIVLQSETERASLARGPATSAAETENPFWTAFRRKFPTAWGLTSFTRVGFNPARTEALVQVRHGCGECGSAESILFRKTPGSATWRVKARIPHWAESRESPTAGSLRFVGRGGSMRAARDSQALLRQRELADSVRLARAPRRIRVSVINSLTGRGMPGYPIYQMLGRDDNPERIGVTDARGTLTISNPRVGGWYLDVQCDAAIPFPRSLTGAGFYVAPGLDTSLVLAVRSLAPCWRRRIRPIQSGEAETGARTASGFPDEREAAVYEAILLEMFPDLQTRPLLAIRSIPLCPRSRFQCGSTSSLGLLLREGRVDSATVRDFDHKSGDLIPFSPGFAERNGLVMLTPSVEQYLVGEAVAATPEKTQHGHEESLWYSIERAYPKARGVLSFTRVGFNSTRTEALVSLRHALGVLQDRYQTMLLRFADNRWRIEIANVETEPVSAEMIDGQCVVARGSGYLLAAELAGVYDFTFVDSHGRVETRTLDTSKRTVFQSAFEIWDISLDHRVMKVRRNGERGLAGTWMDIGRDGYPIDSRGNRIPERHGHFCAARVTR